MDETIVEFNQIAIQRPDFRKSDATFDRFFSKDNVAGIILIKHTATQKALVVGNAHIHWNPEYADVKLIQVAMLTEELERMCPKHNSAILLCGDFNSEPDSGVYELLGKGLCRSDHPDLGRHVYGGYVSSGFKHNLGLKSIFSDREPLFTNYTPRFKGVLDYIWYSSNTLSCTGALGGIDDDFYLSRVVGFPNPHFPSEYLFILTFSHISLAASFRFRGLGL